MLHKKREIAIMEFSSTSIKFLSGTPYIIDSNREDLGKFDTRFKPIQLNLHKYIDARNSFDIELFINQNFHIIENHFKRILRNRPQEFKIVFTGLYRNFINSTELITAIYQKLRKIKNENYFSLELLSPEQESWLSFNAWLNTFTFYNQIEADSFRQHYENNALGLHIEIGGGTTEVTIFQKNNFNNTISIPIGYESVKRNIRNNTSIDLMILETEMYLIDKIILMNLKANFISETKIQYCVCSGSTTIFNQESIKNIDQFFSKENLDTIIRSKTSQILHTIEPYLGNDLIMKGWHHTYVADFSGLSILSSILTFFNIKYYYSNKANLRIGLYYDVIKEKDPNNNLGLNLI